MERIRTLNFCKFSRPIPIQTLVAFVSTAPFACRTARLHCESGTGNASRKSWNFGRIKAKIIRYARRLRPPLLLILNDFSYRLMPCGYTHPMFRSSRKTLRMCKHIHFRVWTTTNHGTSSSARPSQIILNGMVATGTFYCMSFRLGRGTETRGPLPWSGIVPYYSLEEGTLCRLCFSA
jgi:hypothetical protein